ncbi:Long-chain fatty acid transport protein [Pseudorhodobacter antarcticus]|uniref:Long-chain fatty acid transport protein n=1 Tax=Pseudorhodobacter antarcticus TaxID=1077947 RepID=A0A1H8KY97_9RHOB|nr:outer membrane protein transport protein [Pseudorhodobacter antarcticus]SEN97811.1 Long-chain fatty acid transport protein [Pseudorhodobacter antarcticus]
MKKITTTLGAIALTATAAHAGGIDRSGQNIGVLFEKGRVVELSFGRVMPTVSGNDIARQPTGNVAIDYSQVGLAYKYDINEKAAFALIIDQPFGAKVSYGTTSPVLGRTAADASSVAVTGLLRYKLNENFSIHGGLRAQQIEATVDLRGAGYGSLNGYSVKFDKDWGLGYVAGVAYERPEIALRVALTYNSGIKHNLKTTQNFAPAGSPDTGTKSPQSVNLDFQTGVAAGTLMFGQIRWADWSEFKLQPSVLRGNSLVNLDDTTTYTLGVGRKFNENWSGAVSVVYEKEGNPLVSPLAPTTGRLGMTLAGIYTRDNMKITTGINYTKLGDATPYTGALRDVSAKRADFSGNKAVGVGIKVAYSF